MEKIELVLARRAEIAQEMLAIRAMRKGTINEQFLQVPRVGQAPAERGPYYVISRRQGGKTVSKRLKPGAELEQARAEVAAYARFAALCQEFEQLTEQLAELDRGAASVEKKTPKRSSSKTKK